MRYFLITLVLITAFVVGILGFRGSTFRKPPLEVFPDMKRQPRLRPQKPNPFFNDNQSSRMPVAGTVAVDAAIEDLPVYTGRIPGTTNYVETNPLPITQELLAVGRERFTIYCSPCHSATGDGNGITSKYGMIRAGNFHDARLVRMPDGEIFNTVTMGKNLMASYASQVSISNRWAIIAYIRALERARLATVDDVPADKRATLK
jgi:mono/diheme cytochrome c family protein